MHHKMENYIKGIILGVVFLMSNQLIPFCYLLGFKTPRLCEVSLIPAQLVVFIVLSLIVLWLIRYYQMGGEFWRSWRTNWMLIAFLILALLSSSWSVFSPLTISRAILILFISLVASYYGSRFAPKDLISYLAVFGGVIAVCSIVIGLFRPDLAIMSNSPYEGLWRGVFWHKVYFGAELSLGYIALIFIVFSPLSTYSLKQKIVATSLAIACVVLAILSDSATGLILLVIQSSLFGVLLIWLKFRTRISRKMYLLLGGTGLLLFANTLLNLKTLFGLFNRSTSLTGRIPLWNYLISEYVSRRPFFGYGFSAFWYQPGINGRISNVTGWLYGVGVSDNGYMDILLGLGLFGLVLLVGLIGAAVWRSIRTALQQMELVHYFPLFVMIHIFLVNFTLSYFVESESFIWFLLVVVLFLNTKKDKQLKTT